MARQLATTRSITAKALTFCDFYVNDPETAGNASASARKAGFAERSAGQEGHRLLRHDGVRAAIDALVREALGDHAAAAVQLLGRVVRDERMLMKLRLDAAKTILDRAGHIAPKAVNPTQAPEKATESMSYAELLRMLKASEEKIGAMIDVTPEMEAVDMEEAVGSGPPAAAG
jgi:phage terminase small subunit